MSVCFLQMNPPLYGADVPGSLFDERLRGWNLKRLNSLLSTTLESSGAAIPGVTQPYLYAGSWRSFFAWHTEDLDLHSVNYLHTGKPKTWYVVPPAARERFELLARDLLPELSRCCPEFLRHKEILMSPALLAAHNIPLVKAVHNAREFVVVGPGAYHAGFNHGFNIAESVNFATKAWVPVGARASFCTCRPDSVKIDMRLFLDYMDTDLAQEVKESYRSDSEDESDEEESEEEEESDAEGSEEEAEAGAGDETSSSEEESSSDEESEEEELPAKRLRRPSAKAAASGLVYSYSPPPAVPPAASAKQARPAALQRLNKDQRGIGRRQGKGVSPPARRQSPVLKEQKALAAARKARQGKAAAAAAARRRPAVPVSRKRSVLRGDGNRKVVSAAAAAAAVHASSDDESQDGAIRAGSKRGAAQAWYRLFDSLLPALKRARA